MGSAYTVAIIVLIATAGGIGRANASSTSCVVRHGGPPTPRILTPPPRSATLPAAFDWRNVNGTSYVTAVRNQFLPQWCGSCWAQATTSALSDRLKIMRLRAGDVGPDVQLSPQPLLDCATGDVGSCEGGDDLKVYEWVAAHGITETTCSPYRAADDQCQDGLSACRICYHNGVCEAVANGTRYFVAEHGPLATVADMQQEIYARGPISCSLYDTVPEFHCYSGGVINTTARFNHTTHVVSLLGWGTDAASGQDFWVARHSGGTYWGEQGFFKIKRGADTLRIESFCYWGTLKAPLPAESVICTD